MTLPIKNLTMKTTAKVTIKDSFIIYKDNKQSATVDISIDLSNCPAEYHRFILNRARQGINIYLTTDSKKEKEKEKPWWEFW